MIYFDNAAATAMDERVVQTMLPYFSDHYFNPSASYMPAINVHRAIDEARKRIAGHLGVKSSEIIFTAGATEANNLAIKGLLTQFKDSNIIASAIEHDSVIDPASQFNVALAPVTSDGIIDVTKLVKLIDDNTVLISVMLANNEIGTIQPIKQLYSELAVMRKNRQARSIKRPLYLHTDAAQAGNYLDLHVSRLGVDLMTINGGKIYGPKQTGFLYKRSAVKLQALIHGGGQEFGLRSGTENVAGIIGLAEALDIAQSMRQTESIRIKKLQNIFIEKLSKQLPAVSINGSLSNRLPNNIHITIPGTDNERLMMQLEDEGIICAIGSACSASDDEPSHVLKAIGLSDQAAQSSLRITMGRHTQSGDVTTFAKTLEKLLT